jgi:hypothetical protein
VAKSWAAFQAAESARETYSFIFIDGSHKIHHITEDLAWTRLLEPGGLVCLHDYEPRFKGVVAALDRFLARHPNYEIVGREDRLAVLKKTARSPRIEISLWDRTRARMINFVHQIAASLRKRGIIAQMETPQRST